MDARDATDPGELRRLQTALTEAEQTRERYEFLAEAASLVGESLDLEATLASVARLAVPRLGSWCAVYILDEEGELRRLAAAHVDPARAELMRELIERYPISADPNHPVRQAIARAETVMAAEVPADQVDRHATGPEHARILRQLGHTAALVAPLTARGQTLGAMSIGPDEAGCYADWVRPSAERLARIAALAIDNARLYRQAKESIRARDEFLASATHDLKTPLTAISGLAQMLERRAARLDSADGERLRAGLAKINLVTLRMTVMINELMDVTRLRMECRLVLERHPTDLVGLARRMVAEAALTTRRHRIEVESDVESLVGRWDAFRLERVIGNLLTNAIKYSPEGGDVRVEVRAEQRDGAPWAVVSVRDQGIGIPAADLPRIFERFHRGRNALGRIRGAGIGLFGARQIVSQHGGTIDVESREGEGSTFAVALPLDGPAEISEAA
ncbi:MAG TPA: GAF domain-containing sensor histidine kinase [Chloroflexota bacterium]|jgi:signal transduction histidine kinase